MITIRKAEDNDLEAVAKLLVKSFSHSLSFLGANAEVIVSKSIRAKGFYVAEQGRIIGVVALSDCNSSAIQLDKRAMKSCLGALKGTILSIFAAREIKPKVILADSEAFIDAVAIDEEFRGNGIAKQMIEHILTQNKYDAVFLEVLDANAAAISSYRKCGFRELSRKRVRLATSYKYKIIMECRAIKNIGF